MTKNRSKLNEIVWHPFREVLPDGSIDYTFPDVEGMYLITIELFGYRETYCDSFSKDDGYRWLFHDNEDVVAWAELPPPFEA